MNHPRNVIEIATRAATQYPNDARAAIDEAVREVSALPNAEEFVASLVRTAIGDLVHAARHKINVAIKKQAGLYGQPAKVVVGKSELIQQMMTSYYNYAVAGTALGNILGRDLDSLAATESSKADGHRFNARLLSRLRTMVPPESRVQEAVPEAKLASLFKEVQQEVSR